MIVKCKGNHVVALVAGVIKRVALTDLPYDVLKNFSFKLPAKVLFCAEDEAETVVVEEFLNGENLFQRLKLRNFLNES